MPALVKAFLEQVMRAGRGVRLREDRHPQAPTGARHSSSPWAMPALAYRCSPQPPACRLRRNIFKFVGLLPVRSTLFGMGRRRRSAPATPGSRACAATAKAA